MTARKPQTFAGHKINPPDGPARGDSARGHRLTLEQREFMIAAINRGLGAREVVRQFFRTFNQDLSVSTVNTARRELAAQAAEVPTAREVPVEEPAEGGALPASDAPPLLDLEVRSTNGETRMTSAEPKPDARWLAAVLALEEIVSNPKETADRKRIARDALRSAGVSSSSGHASHLARPPSRPAGIRVATPSRLTPSTTAGIRRRAVCECGTLACYH